jgi:hypothetical protein
MSAPSSGGEWQGGGCSARKRAGWGRCATLCLPCDVDSARSTRPTSEEACPAWGGAGACCRDALAAYQEALAYAPNNKIAMARADYCKGRVERLGL